MLLDRLTRTEQNARRLAEIVGILAKYGLADWMGGFRHLDWFRRHLTPTGFQRIANESHEARIRLALTDLGTTFIKFGQVLSTRPDIVSPALADELAKLQTDTPPDPPRRRPPDDRRRTGQAARRPVRRVRPGPDRVGLDRPGPRRPAVRRPADRGQGACARGSRPRWPATWTCSPGWPSWPSGTPSRPAPYRPVATVRQFRKALNRELDFAAERTNLERSSATSPRSRGSTSPAPVAELSSKRRPDHGAARGGPRAGGQGRGRRRRPRPDELALRAARVYLQMIFQDGFYHADPHPGNYLVLPGGVLGILDAGMVGRLDDDMRERLESLIVAVYHRDAGRLTDTVTALGDAPPDRPGRVAGRSQRLRPRLRRHPARRVRPERRPQPDDGHHPPVRHPAAAGGGHALCAPWSCWRAAPGSSARRSAWPR